MVPVHILLPAVQGVERDDLVGPSELGNNTIAVRRGLVLDRAESEVASRAAIILGIMVEEVACRDLCARGRSGLYRFGVTRPVRVPSPPLPALLAGFLVRLR